MALRPGAAHRLPPAKAKALVTEAIARFKQAEEAEAEQRARELEDLRFYAGDQWPSTVVEARKAQAATISTPAIPARPTITINKQREPIKQVLNGIRQADLGIMLVPADDFGEIAAPPDPSEIDLREGLLRRIQRSSEAEDARFWGAMRAAIAGRGYYAVCVRYLPGKTFDRELYVERIYNQASVLLDPLHQQPDGSDANWGFKGTDLPWDQYIAQYPYRTDKAGTRRRNTLVDASDEEFRALGDAAPGWFSTPADAKAKNTRIVRVTEYWYVTLDSRELVQLADGSAMWADDPLPDDAVIIDRRPVVERTINWCTLDGHDVLEETAWEGPDLPLIKIMGEELQPYDQERRAQGMVRPGRGAQEGFNAMVSKQVETVAYAPIPPWQYDPEAVEGFEPIWELSSTKPVWGLPSRTYNDEGRELRPPTRTPIDTPIVAIAQSVQLFDMAIKSTMGTGDPELGNVAPSIKSGKALSALIGQSQLGKSDYLDNLKRSIRYEGQILNNLLYPIYGKRPGRLVRIITGHGEEQTIPIASPVNQQAAMPPPGQAPPAPYRLTPDANYNVIIKIVPNSESRRSEEAELLGHVIETQPGAMQIIGDLFFQSLDGPGHEEMAERFKQVLAPQIQQYLAQKANGQPLPPGVMQEMTSMHQQLEHSHQLLMQADQEIKTKQIEQQGKVAITQMQEAAETARAQAANETKIAVAALSAKFETLANAMQLFMEERARVGLQLHEHIQGGLDHHREMMQQADQQAHEQALSAQEHAQTLAQGVQQAQVQEPQPEIAQ